jgi:hypothetical protein
VQLFLGEVKRIIYPADKASNQKRFPIYEVHVEYRAGNGPQTTSTFFCMLANHFGGIADLVRYTLRADPKEPEKGKVITTGARVLVLCVLGDTQRGYIIGGIRSDKGGDLESDGHNLFFEFNGTRFTIDKYGQPTLTFRGATDVKGDLLDSAVAEANGTKIGVDKEGSLTAATPEDKQFIRLNHKDKKIEILADEEWNVEVNGKAVIKTGQDISVETTEGQIDVTAAKKVYIKSEGVHVGDASDAWVKGTTYRQNEETMHSTMKGLLQGLNTAINLAGTFLNVAAGLQKVPVGGAVAASVPLQAAAQALSQAAPLFNQLASAISTFEGSKDSYLSKKNKCD